MNRREFLQNAGVVVAAAAAVATFGLYRPGPKFVGVVAFCKNRPTCRRGLVMQVAKREGPQAVVAVLKQKRCGGCGGQMDVGGKIDRKNAFGVNWDA